MRTRVSESPGVGVHASSAAPASSDSSPLNTWLSPPEAVKYLQIQLPHLIPLVESGRLTLRRSPDHGLRFHRDDLDALLVQVPPLEGARLLAGQVVVPPSEHMHSPAPSQVAGSSSGTLVPLKTAAVQLNFSYKTLLRLVHAGQIPATNLSSSKRPRFVVDVEVIKRQWADLANRDMRRRTSPTAGIDYSRILARSAPAKGEHRD